MVYREEGNQEKSYYTTYSIQSSLSLHWIMQVNQDHFAPVKGSCFILRSVILSSEKKERYKLWLSDCSRVEPQERSHLDFWHVSQHSNSCLVKTLTHVASSRHIGRSIVEPHTTKQPTEYSYYYQHYGTTVTRL